MPRRYLAPTVDALERELRERMAEPHEGKRKVEMLWPVHQINWQRSRYIYDMYYVHKKIARPVYDYCLQMKLCDKDLMAKWKKPGYERQVCKCALSDRGRLLAVGRACRRRTNALPSRGCGS